MKENLCKQAGCAIPSCCKSETIELKGSEEFPNAMPYWEFKQRLAEDPTANIAGVYEPETLLDLPSGGVRRIVYIPNLCPNLDDEGNCGEYESRPAACRNNKRGGYFCTHCRVTKDKLPPVAKEFVE